ncbi:unnamed protein product [Diamesa hyperborea]
MSDLKRDLDEYMLLQEERKSSNFKVNFTMPKIKNPFSNSESSTSNSWLNSNENEDTWCPKMNRIQRLGAFIVCLGLGLFCLILSTFYIPVLLLKARKFALLYSMASGFFIASIGFLSGFKSVFKSMYTKEKLPISITYTISLALTLYFAMWEKSTAFTVVFAVIQIISLGFMLFGAVPKGTTTGVKFFGSMFKTSVSSSLPI